ncbi:MAG: hypothetical protein BGO55_03455 [Sphingobacteriales bacterium 50-39]|nr:MAG: hypothetical protein BGO55_03455 [Sphingobacteriales bacterium 50-39]
MVRDLFPQAPSTYAQEMESWRQTRIRNLKATNTKQCRHLLITALLIQPTPARTDSHLETEVVSGDISFGNGWQRTNPAYGIPGYLLLPNAIGRVAIRDRRKKIEGALAS